MVFARVWAGAWMLFYVSRTTVWGDVQSLRVGREVMVVQQCEYF